jgi:hypothetical protein
VCALLVTTACGKAADGSLVPTGANADAASDAASMNEGSATTGSAGSNSSSNASDATPGFGTPGTGALPGEMPSNPMGPAIDETDASTSLAVQCPEMDEEILASLDGEQFVLGSHSFIESTITNGCDGVLWNVSSCNASDAVCLRVRSNRASQGPVATATLRVAPFQDEWLAELEATDLGETFWCQENNRWKVRIDTTFTKPATQLEDGPTRTLEVTLKTYVEGQTCPDI